MTQKTDAITFASLRQNPIIQAEFHYQRFIIRNGRVGALWIVLAALMVLPAILMSLIYSLAVVLGGILPDALRVIPFVDNEGFYTISIALLLTMMIAMYSVVTLINLALAARSIQREKENRTWDNLRLTDIGAGKIVVGKWWASLRALNGDFLMVTLIRMGFVSFYLVGIAPALDIIENLTSANVVFTRSAIYTPYALFFLFLTAMYGILDAALTAALGILAPLPDEALGSVVGTLAVGVRLLTMAAAAGWFALTLNLLRFNPSEALFLAVGGLGIYLVLLYAVLAIARRLVG